MIKNFRHTCIIVKDINKSLKFYKDTLGLKISKIRTVEGKYPETAFNIKGIKLTYVKMRTPNQPKNSPPVFELHCWEKPNISSRYNHISFTVKDIDYEYERLSKCGIKFISKPIKTPYSNTKICFAYDPDNNLIELIEELKNKNS